MHPVIVTPFPTPLGFGIGTVRNDNSCPRLCESFDDFTSCKAQMKQEFDYLLHVNDFDEVETIVQCGSILITVQGRVVPFSWVVVRYRRFLRIKSIQPLSSSRRDVSNSLHLVIFVDQVTSSSNKLQT